MKIKNHILILILTLGIVTSSCVSSRFVEPLEKGTHAIGLDLGGPLLDFGKVTIPTPLSSISYGYGLDTNLTAFIGVHTTSLLFNNFHTDFGATYKFIDQNKFVPSVSGSFSNTIVASFRTGTTRYWPQIDVNGFWNFSEKKHFWYIGMSNWFELRPKRAHDQDQIKRWIVNPQIGATFKMNTFRFNIEYKVLAIGVNSKDVFVPYRSLSKGEGAMGIYLGISKTF